MNFLRKYWIPIVAGIAGLIFGYFANVYANKQSEKRIIDAITAEIEALKAKQQAGRITASEQQRINELQMQLNVITGKVGICSDCTQTWQKENCPNCKAS